MRELFCDECKKKLDFVYVHGYDFGDRIMEGVRFKVRVIDGKPECFGLHPDSEPYMVQFNWEHWKQRCEEFCERADLAECPHCREDVLVENDEIAESRPKPIAIGKAESAIDVLKKLKFCILMTFIIGVAFGLILTS